MKKVIYWGNLERSKRKNVTTTTSRLSTKTNLTWISWVRRNGINSKRKAADRAPLAMAASRHAVTTTIGLQKRGGRVRQQEDGKENIGSRWWTWRALHREKWWWRILTHGDSKSPRNAFGRTLNQDIRKPVELGCRLRENSGANLHRLSSHDMAYRQDIRPPPINESRLTAVTATCLVLIQRGLNQLLCTLNAMHVLPRVSVLTRMFRLSPGKFRGDGSSSAKAYIWS